MVGVDGGGDEKLPVVKAGGRSADPVPEVDAGWASRHCSFVALRDDKRPDGAVRDAIT